MTFPRSGVLSLTRPQVLSGLLSFHHLHPLAALAAILSGKHPEKPLDASSLGLTDALWDLLQLCWSESASARPTARQLFDHLHPASLKWVPPNLRPPAEEAVSTLSSDTFGVSGVPLSDSVGGSSEWWLLDRMFCFLLLCLSSFLFSKLPN